MTWGEQAKRKGGREGPVNHRIWPGIKACSCGRVDRRPAFNGKSLDAKGDVSNVRALLLQKLYEIILQELSTGTLMKSTFW